MRGWTTRRRTRGATADEDGVYLLANDAVAPWLAACAASLRHFNPSVRVVVIAFDDALDQIGPLCVHHDFELWRDRRLRWYDKLGKGLSGPFPAHLFRKLAILSGPLARFLYIDVDTLVLMDLQPVLEAVAAHPEMIQFAHCDAFGGNIDEIYRPGPWREEFVGRHGSHAASAGIWAASRGALTQGELFDLAHAARPCADQLLAGDQGFLNFCLDVSGAPVGNIHDHIEPQMVWAGVPGYERVGRELRSPHGRPIGLVHWAGYALEEAMPYRDLWERWG